MFGDTNPAIFGGQMNFPHPGVAAQPAAPAASAPSGAGCDFPGYTSQLHGECVCVGNTPGNSYNVYRCADGNRLRGIAPDVVTQPLPAGAAAPVNWVPYAIGAAALGGVLYLLFRK